ncbi:MAG: hypothetical protein QM756_35155 [Polyangiaceae bacterium]
MAGCGGSDDPSTNLGSGGSTSTGNGGATTGNGGATTGNGGATTGNGGATTGSGGASSGGASAGGATTSSGGATTTSGGATSGGASTTNGGATTGGRAAGGASSGGASSGGATSGGASTTSGGATSTGTKFSFFVTSLAAVRRVSGNQNGFGGDLRNGEATGLAGADKICTTIAESSLAGSGAKGWRAFLSTTTVNAIDRVGAGPWYDRMGRLVAQNTAGLLATRPAGDTAIINDLPNESGVPNRAGTGTGSDDNHDTITGTATTGKWDGGATCSDWTNATGSDGPRVGHSWPAGSGMSWIQAHTAPGCEPSVALTQTGAGSGNGIGNGGGYGGFYCFALMP